MACLKSKKIFLFNTLSFLLQNEKLQREYFKESPLGADIFGDTRTSKKKKVADKREQLAKNTSHLFLYAIQLSGSALPDGILHLDLENAQESPEGIIVFLRAVQNFLPNSLDCTQTIDDFMFINNMKECMEGKEWNTTNAISYDKEQHMDICKAAINPLVILLHVDQGSFADATFTPFATPQANNRSIDGKHVNVLAEKLLKEENVIKQEDFSILPYRIHLMNTINAKSNKPMPRYRCTLNRDPESKQTIIAKLPATCSMEEMKWLYEVS